MSELSIKDSQEIFKILVDAFRQQFEESKADNFVTYSLTDPSTKEVFEFTILKHGKEAPADHIEKYLGALRAIDSHIRCTEEPVDFIIHELKKVLPEYKEVSPDDYEGENEERVAYN